MLSSNVAVKESRVHKNPLSCAIHNLGSEHFPSSQAVARRVVVFGKSRQATELFFIFWLGGTSISLQRQTYHVRELLRTFAVYLHEDAAPFPGLLEF